uniref:Uncharacterized protein n=1 Tax=Sinocyclocheilus anshuiensis TaxID=1608454 RepID=A0A671NBS6_9TELE
AVVEVCGSQYCLLAPSFLLLPSIKNDLNFLRMWIILLKINQYFKNKMTSPSGSSASSLNNWLMVRHCKAFISETISFDLLRSSMWTDFHGPYKRNFRDEIFAKTNSAEAMTFNLWEPSSKSVWIISILSPVVFSK